MIWNDEMILHWIDEGGVEPYDLRCVNPASLDLRWSGNIKTALHLMDVDTHQYVEAWSEVANVTGFSMQPGHFYLLDTLEYIKMPPDCVGKLFLKSSAGRMGIEHLHAGYVDSDFMGTLTMELEIRVPWPVTIMRGQRIMQLTIEKMIAAPLLSYRQTGRYQKQRGPTASKGLPK